MDPELREYLEGIDNRIQGIGLRLDGLRHDFNALMPSPDRANSPDFRPKPGGIVPTGKSSSSHRKEPMNTEPVLLTTAVAVVLYNVATVLGIGVDQDTVTQLVVSVGAIVAAIIARKQVTPV